MCMVMSVVPITTVIVVTGIGDTARVRVVARDGVVRVIVGAVIQVPVAV